MYKRQVYTDQQLNGQSSFNYFRGNLETSGNFLWAIDKVFNIPRVEKNDERYYEMLGVQYAQYIKADGEYRFNHYLNRANTIVYRLFLGCGYPYGNMKVLPFEEAFYGGGANGIRAGQARTLGPDVYKRQDLYCCFGILVRSLFCFLSVCFALRDVVLGLCLYFIQKTYL